MNLSSTKSCDITIDIEYFYNQFWISFDFDFYITNQSLF
jgi:hypothetical protein